MLIRTDRPTTEDVQLWSEYESADAVHAGRPRMGRLVRRSMEAIAEFISGGACYTGVSWGKDSVVCADLVMRVDQSIPLVNLRVSPTRNPDCDAVRDAFLAMWPSVVYDEIPVSYDDLSHDMPLSEWDRETDRRWNAGFAEAGRRYGNRHISGVAARESWTRKIRCCRWGENSDNASAPLAWWDSGDVFAYLAARRLPVHPAYACLGGGRWPRDQIRVAEIGDAHGVGMGRREWEQEYYPEVLAAIRSPHTSSRGGA